jgi:type IV secretory pathway TraG/TraD family ATPase VirD4
MKNCYFCKKETENYDKETGNTICDLCHTLMVLMDNNLKVSEEILSLLKTMKTIEQFIIAIEKRS